MQIVRYGASCVSALALLLAAVAAAVAAAKNRREGRPFYGGLILALGWSGSLIAALIFLGVEIAGPSFGRSPWISLFASYLNTFMTLMLLVGTALLLPRKPRSDADG